ncbi:dephospho-CoA kinase/protein folding accessory domain-containing protein [Poriferisphaera corsica]|uniref:Dephospho-CoA kinase/protein folding accessory domain-containing protein n=1 Tax=Poriferisphaera corsica TaxID=2528020 RepID=A0A517YSR3_9BACT|nr:GrpB family protein [Poriferisphaera corsica]QDU33283.1 dephospho-CoA kinase/protein folding accessory domain-containing protein [Poriferisphaera corsica]
MQKQIIEILDYNPAWPMAYQKESQIIVDIFCNHIVRIHHIGSTSVPNLKAKPIIDIMLEVDSVSALDRYNNDMEQIGYTPKGEFGILGRRFYLKGLYNRTHHIHAFQSQSLDAIRHLAFRDYLIAHPNIAREYEQLKIRCANECRNDMDKYCDGKHEFVQLHERKAVEWYQAT